MAITKIIPELADGIIDTIDALTKTDIGLGSVDNTSDADKPISTATQTALDLKQPLDADLTAIATLTTTSFGRGFLDLADQAAGRTKLDIAQKQSSTLDSTAGKGLIVGGFGLGGKNATISDADALLITGMYTVPSTWTGSPFAGTNGNNQGYLFHQQWDIANNNYAIQDFSNVNNIWAHFRRRKDAGVWGAWYSVYDQKNILGAVSQSSGVATGAVIERGSNANGEFVKFADGTMICTRQWSASLAVTTIYAEGYYGVIPWTYPATFSTIHHGSLTGKSSGRLAFMCGLADNAFSTTTINFYLFDIDASHTATYLMGAFAIGRWF